MLNLGAATLTHIPNDDAAQHQAFQLDLHLSVRAEYAPLLNALDAPMHSLLNQTEVVRQTLERRVWMDVYGEIITRLARMYGVVQLLHAADADPAGRSVVAKLEHMLNELRTMLDYPVPQTGDAPRAVSTLPHIFVFGSNLAGRHGKGAALTARNNYGASYGNGVISIMINRTTVLPGAPYDTRSPQSAWRSH